ncbi:MAG: hypothetical protein AAGH99_15065 [Planctomycetota bacterium]
MDRYDLQNRYLDLTRVTLPSLGRTRNWVVKEDHCFMRIVLDHVFADCWYNHLDRRLRAYKQLNDTQLAQAVAIAERMAKADAEAIDRMNVQSLLWRDKPVPNSVRHHSPSILKR